MYFLRWSTRGKRPAHELPCNLPSANLKENHARPSSTHHAEASRGQQRSSSRGRPASVASQVFSFQGGQNSMKSSETIRGSLPGRHSVTQAASPPPHALPGTVAFIMHQPASSWLMQVHHFLRAIVHHSIRSPCMRNEYRNMGRRILS